MDTAARIEGFFAGKPMQWKIFEALRTALAAQCPNAGVRVMKTCNAFDDPKPLCYVSFPPRKR